MKMTYVAAIENAIEVMGMLDSTECDRDATIERLETLRATLVKRGERSDETKAKAKAKRADARSALMAQVLPILRDAITADMTAKEIFTAAADRLPKDFTDKKVQYILLNEMKDEVIKTEAKGKPNTYRLAE